MTYINKDGYVEKKTNAGKKNPNGRGTRRDWWLVKYVISGHISDGAPATIGLGHVSIPRKYIGKKIRFKLEVIEE